MGDSLLESGRASADVGAVVAFSRSVPRTLIAAATLIAALVGAYAFSLRGEFLWDDDLHITANPTIVGPLGLKEIWTTSRANYFPLVLTNFWAQHALWGLEPFGYRVVTLAFHALAALLLWRVLRQLRAPGAWVGATLWALHPVQVESVAWICELKNTQSAVFFLGAIWFWVKWLQVGRVSDPLFGNVEAGKGGSKTRPTCYGLALVFAVLAILSKPSTVMLPVALGLCAWWVREGPGTRDQGPGTSGAARTPRSLVFGPWSLVLSLAPFFALSALAAGWTIWEQKFHSGAVGPEWDQTWAERVAIAGRVVWFYLGKLLWPEPLIFIYPRWSVETSSVLAFAPVLAVVGVLAVLWRKQHGPLRPVFFAALYFGALLFPVLGFFDVYFFRYSFVGDHFQYLASMGPLALLGAGIARLPARGAIAAGAAAVLALGVLTWRHTAVFRSNEILWRDTVAKNPGTKMAWLNLGDTYSKQRRSAEAIAAYRRGLAIAPNDAPGHNDLGCELMLTGRVEEALPHLERAVQLKATAEHITNLGSALRKVGRGAEAIALYERALQLDPTHAAAHNNLGADLAEMGRLADALRHFETALRLTPNDPATLENVGSALQALGRIAEAVAHYERALRLEPNRVLARKRLADALLAQGRAAEALALLEEAVRRAPRSAEAHNSLGGVLARLKRTAEARTSFETAVQLAPDFVAARLNLGVALAEAGRWADAATQFQHAARLRPDLPEPHAQLAVALVNSEQLAAAVAPFEQALRLRPDAAELHNNFGQLLRALGRNREAFEHLEEAARLQREARAKR